jgi:hypothetical protein
VGFSQAKSAANLEITEPTLRLHYRRELDHATEIICGNALARQVKASNSGIGSVSVKASLAILVARGGWVERHKLDVDDHGKGLTTILKIVADAGRQAADGAGAESWPVHTPN